LKKVAGKVQRTKPSSKAKSPKKLTSKKTQITGNKKYVSINGKKKLAKTVRSGCHALARAMPKRCPKGKVAQTVKVRCISQSMAARKAAKKSPRKTKRAQA
jgi:hypothetical protein